MLLALAVSFLAGVTRTVARMVNAQLAARVGPLQSTFYTYVLGLLCSGLALGLSREAWPGAALTAGQIPVWAYAGGAVGVLFIVLSNLTTPKISAVLMTLLIFVGQITTGLALDFLIQHHLSPAQIAGGLLMLAGLLGYLWVEGRRG